MRLPIAFVLALCCIAVARDGSPGNVPTPLVHTGTVDGSAGVALDAEHFVAASDEENILRVYCREHGGAPLQSIDLTQFLDVPAAAPETDIEAATRIGDRVYWISSHGRNSRGKEREARCRFFATDIVTNERGVGLLPAGKPYRGLLNDLVDDKQLQSFKLTKAAARAPKSAGGLSIEGLCATPDKRLLIGFRNPIPQGRALVVPLLNADAVIEGQRAQFGPPIRLDLGGMGIRDMVFWEGEYIIIAGPPDGKGQSRLYRWAGDDNGPMLLKHVSFQGFNPEAVIVYPDKGLRQVQLLSDDGKDAQNNSVGKPGSVLREKQFRSIWILLPPALRDGRLQTTKDVNANN